jgi:lipopolysaccharide/colanic/teichoic acid biosynthesis glycosyltransferase
MSPHSTNSTTLAKTWMERLRRRAIALWPIASPARRNRTAARTHEDHRLSGLEQLEVLILAERLRADRFGTQFCAVTFMPGDGRSDPPSRPTEHTDTIAFATLERRVRATDIIGRVAPDGVGVVLPNTAPDGALVFALEIVAEIRAYGRDVSYSIYSHPLHPTGVLPSDSEAEPRRTAANRVGDGDGSGGVAPCGRASDRAYIAPIADLLPPFRALLWKRAPDVLGAVAGILFLTPLFVVLAAYIRIVSPGPVFLRQERIGMRGRTFRMWKLRTMYPNADIGVHRQHALAMIADDGGAERPMRKLDGADSRIIPGGLWLRRMSIDELPQLLNVLLGEMSLVGPRPEMPYAFAVYQPWHTRRFEVLPGMTGLWQVSGKNRTTFREMIRLDIHYGRALSPLRDLEILARTLPVVLGGDNGEEEGGLRAYGGMTQ